MEEGKRWKRKTHYFAKPLNSPTSLTNINVFAGLQDIYIETLDIPKQMAEAKNSHGRLFRI